MNTIVRMIPNRDQQIITKTKLQTILYGEKLSSIYFEYMSSISEYLDVRKVLLIESALQDEYAMLIQVIV